ncbi:sugar ABC transporter permease YjfF, partial [Acidovorax cattleyae]|nr:sugar ABC transporter permease YjfF [Paracidovorax cattleyae]
MSAVMPPAAATAPRRAPPRMNARYLPPAATVALFVAMATLGSLRYTG